jgi:Protein of unknown function (DUF664)
MKQMRVDEQARPEPPQDSGEAATLLGFLDYLGALWSERVNRSRDVVKAQLSQDEDAALGRTHAAWGRHWSTVLEGRVSLRWVVVRVIEEYARHNGRTDLIRVLIDGQTGD